MAAALSYYTVFSLPPLLLLVLMVLGLVVDPSEVQGRISSEVAATLGAGAGEQMRQIMENVGRPDSGGPLVTFLGIAGLLFGATGALSQLQGALTRSRAVRPPDRPDEPGDHPCPAKSCAATFSRSGIGCEGMSDPREGRQNDSPRPVSPGIYIF